MISLIFEFYGLFYKLIVEFRILVSVEEEYVCEVGWTQIKRGDVDLVCIVLLYSLIQSY